MDTSKPNLHLVKDTFSQMRQVIEFQMRNAVLSMAQGLFNEELEKLCGKPFQRKNGALFYRGGWDPGSIIVEGKKIAVKKPRVKSKCGEVELQSYSSMQNYDLLCNRVVNHMLRGVSTRNYEPLLDEISGGLGLKKSTVSSAFVKESRQCLEAINSRDLKDKDIRIILMDGINFANRTIVVAMGISAQGKKYILGLREGTTENIEVCKDLLSAIIDRGISAQSNYLFVIDGGKALRSSLNKMFKKSIVQRCSFHKLSNLKGYIDKIYWPELNRRWRKLHGQTKYDVALEDYKKILEWLENINHEAAKSLEEADKETLTVVKLKVPRLLRVSLHTTNAIESAFSQVRDKSHRIKNWNSSNDQISRWAAISLMQAEQQFMTLKGYKQIPMVMEELQKQLEKRKKVA